MTYTKLPGVYFSETVTGGLPAQERTYPVPLYIIQGATELPTLDNQLVRFSDYNTFKTLMEGKGFTNSVRMIRESLDEARKSEFYVYSVKTDTAAHFKSIVTESAQIEEIQDVVYYEQSKSSQSNSFNNKFQALVEGAEQNYEDGVFRNIIAVPRGTVVDAVTNKGENETAESAAITAMQACLAGITSGRALLVCPDNAYMEQAVGRLISLGYDEEAGYARLNARTAFEYNFSYSQLVTIMNMGVTVVRTEIVGGETVPRIVLGVTASFSQNKADGLFKARKIADETLRRIKTGCSNLVKSTDMDEAKALAQTTCDVTLDNMISEKALSKSATIEGVTYKTTLKATIVDRNYINISGTLVPTGSLVAINVNTTIA